MTFAAQMIADLDVFLDSDAFAVACLYTHGGVTKTIVGIFDEPTRVVNAGTGEIETTEYRLMVKSSDVVGAEYGDMISGGARTFYITGILDDGTGVTTLLMRT